MHKPHKSQFGQIQAASFKPSFTWRNAHLQTIVPKFFIKSPNCTMRKERITTPDKDFLDLAWSVPNSPKAMVVLFHGLEGSSESHYIKHLVVSLNKAGFGAVLMHFRGCSGEPNLNPKAYHSGATFDPEFIVPIIKQRYTALPLFAVGFSLGGNMLMKLMANYSHLPIEGSVSVSAPLNLAASSEAINKGFARVYQRHLMGSMKANIIKKMLLVDMSNDLLVSEHDIHKMTRFRQFDDHITSVLHGYKDADDYYKKCSALPDLHKIDKPTLIIHAADDPFMNDKVIPTQAQINNNIAYELSQYGGHVGFLTSLTVREKLWLPSRITDFVSELTC